MLARLDRAINLRRVPDGLSVQEHTAPGDRVDREKPRLYQRRRAARGGAGGGAGVTGGRSTGGAIVRCGRDSAGRGGVARGGDGGGDESAVSRPALDGGGTADTSGAGSRAAGEGRTAGGGSERGLVGGGEESGLPGSMRCQATRHHHPRRSQGLPGPSRSGGRDGSPPGPCRSPESRITTGPLPRVFRGFVLNQAFRPSGRALPPPSAATKSRTFENRSAGRLLIARRSAAKLRGGAWHRPRRVALPRRAGRRAAVIR